MNMKSTIALVVLMSSSLALPLPCDWDTKEPAERCLIISAVSAMVVGGTYLLYKLFTWEPSNAKLLSRAQRLYDELNEKYKRIRTIYEGNVLLRYTEQDLATIAFNYDVSVLTYVASDLKSLQDEYDVIRFRIRRDAKKNDPAIEEMRSLLSDMKQLNEVLKLLKQFWSEHSAFFDLYQYIKMVAERYEEARTDVYEADLVRRAIMAMSVNTNQAYPYLHFAEILKRDIDGLKYHMSNARRYEVLYGKAERLCESLVGLLGTVASLPEYKEELHLQKQHQLEQERVDAMREKAEAEREKAAAEREKAHAMQYQAWATLAKPNPQPAHVTVNVTGRDGERRDSRR